MSIATELDPQSWEQLTHEQISAWAEAELAAGWTPAPDALPSPPPHRVSKDTILTRITAAGKLADARTLHGAQSAADKWLFDQTAWFWSDNARMRGFCQTLGLDPAVILAPDEFLS